MASFWYLLPALCLLTGAVVIMLVDLILLRPARMVKSVWWLALITTLVSLGASSLLGKDDVARVLAVLTYDAFTVFVWRLLLVALALIVLLSESYIRHQDDVEPGLFYACLMLFGFGALLLAASDNTIMLLLAVDFLSIVGYVLTGFLHHDKRSTEGAIKYLIYGAAVSAVMAFGLSWLYGLSGTADYALTAKALAGQWSWASDAVVPAVALIPVLIFVLAGFAFKIGAAPFHQWLPDAFEGAPTPVTVSLAIIPKVSGFAALVRLTMTMLPPDLQVGLWWRWPMVALLALAAMTIGNLIGLWQSNIKRLMGYSGIAQVGYALIGVAIATERSLTALLLFLTVYALAELAAFAAITVMSERVRLDTIADYRGLYRRAPALTIVLLISVMSLFGMPGTGGFMGKLWLFISALEAGRIWLLVLAALNSVVSVAYYWRIIQSTFMHSDEGLAPVAVPAASWVVLVLATLGVLGLGLFPNIVLHWAQAAVSGFFLSG